MGGSDAPIVEIDDVRITTGAIKAHGDGLFAQIDRAFESLTVEREQIGALFKPRKGLLSPSGQRDLKSVISKSVRFAPAIHGP